MAESRAGWYPDPSGDESKLRYWDGSQWTNDYADSPNYEAKKQEQAAQDQAVSRHNEYVPYSRTYYVSPQDQTLRLIAFIFCLLSIASSFWLIVPLAWLIPMTVVCWGIYKGTRPNTIAFGVCTLIFTSLVAGILLLVSTKNR